MKLLTTRLVLLSAVCTAAFAVAQATVAATPPPLGYTTRGTLVRAVDGDTLDIQVTYTIRVRLRDCWVPDDNEPVNEQAEEDIIQRAGGQPVVLHIPTAKARGLADLMTLNRVLGDVYHNGESLGAWQVKRGNASSTKNGALGK